MRFTNIFKADIAMATFHIGCDINHVSCAYILYAVGFSPAVSAFNRWFVRENQDTLLEPLRFQRTHMLTVVLTVTLHVISFDEKSTKRVAQTFLRLFALAPQ
jgi:hypothetical protein